MKTFFQALSFILLALSSMVADCYAETYRVHGEIYYNNGQNKGTRRIVSNVISKVPIILKGGNQITSFVFDVEPPPSKKYSMTLSLLSNPKSTGGITTIVLTHTFYSKLVGGENGPFEFETEKNGIKIGGIIALSSIQR